MSNYLGIDDADFHHLQSIRQEESDGKRIGDSLTPKLDRKGEPFPADEYKKEPV